MNIAFNQPWYLLLLLLIPIIWYFGRDSLSGLGTFRRFAALALRTAVLLLIVFSLAEMQYLRSNDKLTVIYLLDQSSSVPAEQRSAMLEYVKADVAANRKVRDKAAVIIFGREALIEEPPVDDNLEGRLIAGQLATSYQLRPDATNLAEALKLAQATFPEDSGRRIVVVSDGNENDGDALAIAEVMAADGVGVDVVPVILTQRAEIEVDKVAIPVDTRKGQPFVANVVVNNLAQPTENDEGLVTGTLRVWRRQGKDLQVISEEELTLPPGKSVFQFRNSIEEPDFYEYQAEFVPQNPDDDVLVENNRATAFTQVLGAANVLLIEDWQNPGEFDPLVERLRDQDIQITVQSSDRLFTDLAELQRYDCVMLANVPRSSGTVDTLASFSDEQIQILVNNTQKLGCGLIMLGGPNSFGAGGWTNTELEKAMPVDFQIYNAKVVPVGALAMVMHASEMSQGNYWQKIIAREALNVLGPNDYCGVVHWTGKESWLWAHPKGLIQVGQNKNQMMSMIGRMTPGDMPEFDPSLKMAAAGFAKLDAAAVKHMIVISDGDPAQPTNATLKAFQQLGAKISTVAVGTHGPAGSQVLQRIAQATGGKYYVVRNPQALPRIFQKETMRVARPLVKEQPGIQPQINYRHEILSGIDSVPPIDGFVLTSKKENSLVDVIMTSPVPTTKENATVLATWTYGAGRTAVLTTDAGHRWANRWTEWPGYDQFFGQLVRYAMRPTGDQGNFSVATQLQDGQGKVIITAMDNDDNLLNFLNVVGDVIRPDMSSTPLRVKQVAPGRYEGEFDATEPGSYFLSLAPGPGYGLLRSGVNVPYSAEYRDRESNQLLLEALANMKPTGGVEGELISVNLNNRQIITTDIDTFRRDLPKTISTQDIWPLLVLFGACLFLADVFVRRVAISFDWIMPLVDQARVRLFGGQLPEPDKPTMARLRSRKAEVASEIDERKSATRFQPDPDSEIDTSILTEEQTIRRALQETSETQAMAPGETGQDTSYTERLLRAKQAAQRKNQNDDDQSSDS